MAELHRGSLRGCLVFFLETVRYHGTRISASLYSVVHHVPLPGAFLRHIPEVVNHACRTEFGAGRVIEVSRKRGPTGSSLQLVLASDMIPKSSVAFRTGEVLKIRVGEPLLHGFPGVFITQHRTLWRKVEATTSERRRLHAVRLSGLTGSGTSSRQALPVTAD